MPPVDFKVKGLLKGLRYISQVFDGEKEQEMQIGVPTDVKHVAHIGVDGPATSNANPRWMNDFQSEPSSTTPRDEKEGGKPQSKAISSSSPLREPLESPKKQRRARRHASSESVESDSPARDPSSRGTRHSRKNQSTGSAPGTEATESESRHRTRRHTKSDNTNGCEPATADPQSIPKQSRRRKTKGTDGGSTRSTHRSKDSASDNSSIRTVALVGQVA